MRRAFLICLLILTTSQLFAQARDTNTPAPAKTAPEAKKPDGKTDVGVPGPNGLGDLQWGTIYDEARNKFVSLSRSTEIKEKVQIVSEVKNKSILVRRNNLLYMYRFYKRPSILTNLKEKEDSYKGGEKKDHGGRPSLYSVGIFFSPVPSVELKTKIEGKGYGKPTKEIPFKTDESIDEEDENAKEAAALKERKEGAYIWDFSEAKFDKEGKESKVGGFIIQWVEPYLKKGFTKRLDYFSSEHTDAITKDHEEYFSVREKDLLLDLINESALTRKEVEKKDETTPTPGAPTK